MRRVYLSDTRSFSRVLTPQKLANLARLRYSYMRSRLGKNVRHRGMPSAIAIEPTTACNLRCPECPSGLRSFSRPTGMLASQLYQQLIDELSPYLMHLTYYFQGEPYLHPGSHDMIAYASSRGIYTITSTNGHYLSESHCEDIVRSGLSRLIVSVDGADQESYASYRVGGNLEKVLQGLRTLADTKRRLGASTPHIVMQTIAFRSNEAQLAELQSLAKKAGADEWVLKSAQVYNYDTAEELLPRDGALRRYKKIGDVYVPKSAQGDACWRMWHSAVMTWDGKVVPCCFDKDAGHTLGDFTQESFADIWHSLRYTEMRQAVFEDRKLIDICANCSEGCRVWMKPTAVNQR